MAASSDGAYVGGQSGNTQGWVWSQAGGLSFTVDGGTKTPGGPAVTVNNGDTVRVTVKLTQDPGTSWSNGMFVAYQGQAGAPTAAYEWPFTVMTPAGAAANHVKTSLDRAGPHYLRPHIHPL